MSAQNTFLCVKEYKDLMVNYKMTEQTSTTAESENKLPSEVTMKHAKLAIVEDKPLSLITDCVQGQASACGGKRNWGKVACKERG